MTEMNQVQRKTYTELGNTGLNRWGGYVEEEFLKTLKGKKGIKAYKEMSSNDPVVGAVLFAVDMIIRQVNWRVEPATESYEDRAAAQFLEECMDDMTMTWQDLVSEIMTMLVFGFSWHEVVYKRRVGDVGNTKFKSKYSDGLIGWAKMPIRSQETLHEWKFNEETGDIIGFEQLGPPNYTAVTIPYNKSLLFRTSSRKNNPEGTSILRNAYRPWFFKKRLEETEGIGIERDLAGLPVAWIPAEFLSANATDDQKAMAEAFKKLVRNVRRDEQEGLVLPMEYDPETGNPMYKFELLNSGGSRSLDISGAIERYEQRIAMTILADFILLGHEKVGSYALNVSKTGIFRTALSAWVDSIAETINRFEVPRIFDLNGWKLDELPKIIPGDVEAPDLAELGQFISSLTGAGFNLFPNPELEDFLLDAAKLPPIDDETRLQQQMAQMPPMGNPMMGGNPYGEMGYVPTPEEQMYDENGEGAY